MSASKALPALAAALVLAACRSPAPQPEPRPAERSPIEAPLVFVRIPATAALPAPDQAAFDPPLGSHIARFDPPSAAAPTGKVVNLTPMFVAAGRPDVSFDGQRVLFVARRSAGEPCSVWEMSVDGTGLRPITTGSAACSAALYLSTIYTLDAETPVYQLAFCAASGTVGTPAEPGAQEVGTAPALFTCRMDGSRVRRITFDPAGASEPYLLSDGRLLYRSRWDARGAALFSVNTDGTDVALFADPEPPAQGGRPCETSDGYVVYEESTDGVDGLGGTLVAVRRARSMHTRRVIALAGEGSYQTPAPLPDGRLLVAYRGRADATYGLYVLGPQDGRRIGCVLDAPEWHEIDGHVVRPRPTPAGRASVVNERATTGFIYCLNAYLSDQDTIRQLAPGTIRRLRVSRARTEGGATSSADADYAAGEPLGDAPVEADGSFFLEVPARTPLAWQLLDVKGNVVGAMRRWVWVMPREGRGCIGCHEDPELSPANRFPLALRQAPRPIGLPPSAGPSTAPAPSSMGGPP